MMDDDAPGRGKDGKTYRTGNTREDGSYAVGRGRPPASTRFAADDGRKRGRRPAGVANLATHWQKELRQKVISKENGQEVPITKLRAVIKRTVERAISGNDRASEIVMRHSAQEQQSKSGVTQSDQGLIDAYLRERAAALSLDPDLFGDPAPIEPTVPKAVGEPERECSDEP